MYVGGCVCDIMAGQRGQREIEGVETQRYSLAFITMILPRAEREDRWKEEKDNQWTTEEEGEWDSNLFFLSAWELLLFCVCVCVCANTAKCACVVLCVLKVVSYRTRFLCIDYFLLFWTSSLEQSRNVLGCSMAQKEYNCFTTKTERGHHCSSRHGPWYFLQWWSNGSTDGSLHESTVLIPKHRLSDVEPQSILHAEWWWPPHPPKCQGLLLIVWSRQGFVRLLPLPHCQCMLFTIWL